MNEDECFFFKDKKINLFSVLIKKKKKIVLIFFKCSSFFWEMDG